VSIDPLHLSRKNTLRRQLVEESDYLFSSSSSSSSSDEEKYKAWTQLIRNPKATDVLPISIGSSKDEEEEVKKEVECSDN
jgi:hypothetical protein